MHNGFLTVNGEKMSKSLGNFVTVKDLLDKGIKGEVIRYALLSTHYRKPLDWTEKLLDDAKKQLDYFYNILVKSKRTNVKLDVLNNLLDTVSDDFNIPLFLSRLHAHAQQCHVNDHEEECEVQVANLRGLGRFLGILQQSPSEWFQGSASVGSVDIQSLIDARIAAKKAKNWAEADRIRNELTAQSIVLEDKPDGTTAWRNQ